MNVNCQLTNIIAESNMASAPNHCVHLCCDDALDHDGNVALSHVFLFMRLRHDSTAVSLFSPIF